MSPKSPSTFRTHYKYLSLEWAQYTQTPRLLIWVGMLSWSPRDHFASGALIFLRICSVLIGLFFGSVSLTCEAFLASCAHSHFALEQTVLLSSGYCDTVPQTGNLNKRSWLSQSSGGWKSKINNGWSFKACKGRICPRLIFQGLLFSVAFNIIFLPNVYVSKFPHLLPVILE